jgi:hypothetical protein
MPNSPNEEKHPPDAIGLEMLINNIVTDQVGDLLREKFSSAVDEMGRKVFIAQAMAWYGAEPIPAFGNRTAESVVKSGNVNAVRDYLDHLATGGYA